MTKYYITTTKNNVKMEELVMKLYAIIIYKPRNVELYRIMKYNVTTHDWELLPGMPYINRADAQSEVDELNQEAGNVTITFQYTAL